MYFKLRIWPAYICIVNCVSPFYSALAIQLGESFPRGNGSDGIHGLDIVFQDEKKFRLKWETHQLIFYSRCLSFESFEPSNKEISKWFIFHIFLYWNVSKFYF